MPFQCIGDGFIIGLDMLAGTGQQCAVFQSEIPNDSVSCKQIRFAYPCLKVYQWLNEISIGQRQTETIRVHCLDMHETISYSDIGIPVREKNASKFFLSVDFFCR